MRAFTSFRKFHCALCPDCNTALCGFGCLISRSPTRYNIVCMGMGCHSLLVRVLSSYISLQETVI